MKFGGGLILFVDFLAANESAVTDFNKGREVFADGTADIFGVGLELVGGRQRKEEVNSAFGIDIALIVGHDGDLVIGHAVAPADLTQVNDVLLVDSVLPVVGSELSLGTQLYASWCIGNPNGGIVTRKHFLGDRVDPSGIEPLASAMPLRRSSQVSYGPLRLIIL